MKQFSDGSVSCDKWDMRAVFAAMKKFNRKDMKIEIDEINIMRDYMTKTFFRRLFYTIRYPFPRVGGTIALSRENY